MPGQKPNTFTLESNPSNTNFEFYSQLADVNRRTGFDAVKANIVALVELTPVLSAPPATGNTSNKNKFVTFNNEVYFIDNLGNSVKLGDENSDTNIAISDLTQTGARTYDLDGNIFTIVSGAFQVDYDEANNRFRVATGDIRIATPGYGLELPSPNGTLYKITVNNGNSLYAAGKKVPLLIYEDTQANLLAGQPYSTVLTDTDGTQRINFARATDTETVYIVDGAGYLQGVGGSGIRGPYNSNADALAAGLRAGKDTYYAGNEHDEGHLQDAIVRVY